MTAHQSSIPCDHKGNSTTITSVGRYGRETNTVQAFERVRMESYPAQPVLPLVGLAADRITCDLHIHGFM